MRCEGWPCDTPHAIYPNLFIKDARKKTVDDILLDCVAYRDETGAKNVCWTGGEPFIQPDQDLSVLAGWLYSEGFNLECFTNGSFLFPDWARERMYFIMDWKLAGSFEAETNRSPRITNALNLSFIDVVKFTVTDVMDLLEAKDVYHTLMDKGCKAMFYVGVVWDKLDNAFLVEWLIKEKLDWTLNIQSHKFIWPADQRGV